MYAYYGAVSWQILGIFLAAGFILATLPFASAGAFSYAGVKVFQVYGFINESVAVILILVGSFLWVRYQGFAEKWARFYPDFVLAKPKSTLQEIIGMVEAAQLPERKLYGPEILFALAIGLAIAYVAVISAFFLSMATP